MPLAAEGCEQAPFRQESLRFLRPIAPLFLYNRYFREPIACCWFVGLLPRRSGSLDRMGPLLVILLAAGLWLERLPAADKKPVTVPGWGSFIDPDGDCRVRQEKGKVTIRVAGTYHDCTYKAPGRFKLNAPRILQEVRGDFRLQVKIHVFPLPAQGTSSSDGTVFTSSGLLAWGDEKNFIRLERVGSGGASSPIVYVELCQDGKSVFRQPSEIADQPTYLRMTRRKHTYTFEVSEDGKEWTELQRQTLVLPEKILVGVLAINTTTRVFAPQLEDLKLGPR